MEKYLLKDDIPVLCLKADSFPDGIMAAHHILHSIIKSKDRMFFGISSPNREGVIQYSAAVDKISEEEADLFGMETFLIRKGTYLSIYIKDYFRNPSLIAEAFQQLIHQPGIDPEGACVEMYWKDTDVRCMVRLK